MKLFKISEETVQKLGEILLDFPFKHQPAILKAIEILRGLEEFVEDVMEKK